MIVLHGLAPRRVAVRVKVFGVDFVEVPPDTGLMSLHGGIALEHELRAWSSALQCQSIARKTAVDPMRLEPPTTGYSLLDLRTAYQWRNLRLDFAISKFLNRLYTSPLGGTWQSALYPPGYAGGTFSPLPSTGRSFDTGFSVKF